LNSGLCDCEANFYHLSHTPALFCIGYFEASVLFFALDQPGLQSSYFMHPAVAEMIGVPHHIWLFSVKMGSCKLFCQGWPGTIILPISAS
jgi:hypothetical protein